jgi:hypothetical protein
VVSREPNPHPPNTPVRMEGRLAKFSHSLILNSLKLTKVDLSQTAIVRGKAIAKVKTFTTILNCLLLVVILKIVGRSDIEKTLANNIVSSLPSSANIKATKTIKIFDPIKVVLSLCLSKS